jgi:hypothetical protein
MAAYALWTGILLLLTSVVAVSLSKPTPTAFIPGILGFLIGLSATVAERNPQAQRQTTLIALGLALLAFLGSLRAVPTIWAVLNGDTAGQPVATLAQFAVLVFTGFFLVRGLRWWRSSRPR